MDLVDLLEWPRRNEVPGMLFRRLISRHALVGLEGMSRAEQVLWLIFELCGEVSNGGIDQFFSNSAGDTAALVPGALRDLGHASLAAAFEKMAQGLPADRGERANVLGGLRLAKRAEFDALEQQVTDAIDALLLELVGWIAARPKEFQLANAGLCAFRPVDVPPDLKLDELFGPGVGAEEALPALYVRWNTGRALSAEERTLRLALHAFGEISDEGPVSYFFCRRADEAIDAHRALEAVGATQAAKVMAKALAAFPFTADLLERRARLARLDPDRWAALAQLQWAMDDLRVPTLEALFNYAKAHRSALK